MIAANLITWQSVDAIAKTLAVGPAAPQQSLLDAHRRAAHLSEFCARFLEWEDIRVRAEGVVARTPSVLVANHTSWLDPLVLASLVPCSPLAKAELRSWPVIGHLATRLGVFYVERGQAASGARALRVARRRLEAGISILVFPEGTTTRAGQRLAPLHRGIFGLARRMRVPVVPMGLRWSDAAARWHGDATLLGHLMSLRDVGPLTCDVSIAPPLPMPRGVPLGRIVDEARDVLGLLSDSPT